MSKKKCPKIGITGVNGFIGKNLLYQLHDLGYNVHGIKRGDFSEKDFSHIIHSAGVNRPPDDNFAPNYEYAKEVCKAYPTAAHLYLSSTQVNDNTSLYAASKRLGEDVVMSTNKESDVIRLPNVYGKWCRPDYNSVVATFIDRKLKGESLKVLADRKLRMVHVDEVVEFVIDFIEGRKISKIATEVTTSKIAQTIEKIALSGTRMNLSGDFEKKIYSTLLSATEPKKQELKFHTDDRGDFVELMRGNMNGQFSYNLCLKGKQKGNHYHHTKVERFVCVHGELRVTFNEITTGKEVVIDLEPYEYVDVPPAWNHTVSADKCDAMFVIFTPFEFDEDKPDTFTLKN